MGNENWALVTGGNRGLGFEVARKLVAAGHPLVLTARDAAAGAAAADKLRAERPDAAVEVAALDVADPSAAAALPAALGDKKVDLLVNNAGIAAMDDDGAGAHARTVGTNLDGALAVTLALLPKLADGARVVMVSSGLGARGLLADDYAAPIAAAATLDEVKAAAAPYFGPEGETAKKAGRVASYSVSKAALNRAVQILAADEALARRGISVVAVCPGWCATDMGKQGATDGRAPPRTPEQGAASILAAADATKVLNGSFTLDGAPKDWIVPDLGN